MKIIIVFGFSLTAFAHLCAANPEHPLPSEWKPDLSLVEDVVTRHYEHGGQQGFNLQTGRIYEIRDFELALIYLQLYGVLSPKAQHGLKAEQAKWLKYRDNEVDKVTPKDSERGTIAPMEENDLATKITEERIKELKARFEKTR
jgi:uncharacterized protein YecT (DUF1311 family)